MRFFDHQATARQRSFWLSVAFAVAVAAVVVAVNVALALAMLLWPPNWWGGFALPQHFWATNSAVVLLFVFGGWAIERGNLGRSGTSLAQRAGARAVFDGERVSPAFTQANNLVQEMALSANMVKPTLMVLPRKATINAFAAGWSARDAVVAVTEGALDNLSREELSGLIAHELSHIREGDTRLNMRLIGLCSGLEMLWRFGCTLSDRDDEARLPPTALVGLPIKWAGWVGHAAALWLRGLVMQEREYLADARAMQWTRNPEALGGTLRKLLWQQEKLGLDFAPAHPLVAHMQFQADPGDTDELLQWFEQHYATHPPVHARIERIYGEPMEALPCGESPRPVAAF